MLLWTPIHDTLWVSLTNIRMILFFWIEWQTLQETESAVGPTRGGKWSRATMSRENAWLSVFSFPADRISCKTGRRERERDGDLRISQMWRQKEKRDAYPNCKVLMQVTHIRVHAFSLQDWDRERESKRTCLSLISNTLFRLTAGCKSFGSRSVFVQLVFLVIQATVFS